MANLRESDRPNIIFIITDQQRGDCLGVLGHPVLETPNLDMMARQGALFTASYSPCPSCIAARASMFTGQRPTTHGRLGYQDRVPWQYDATLAEELSRGGYQTHCVGKTHFYPQRAHLGFHSLESYEGNQHLDGGYVNDYHEWLSQMTHGQIGEFDHGVDSNSWYARPCHLPEHLHNNTWVVTRGIDFLRRRDPTRPFFLNLSFHRPHPPVDPPQVFYDRYRDAALPPVPIGDWAARHDVPVDDVNAWQGHLPEPLLAQYRRAYFAQIAAIDNQIGRLLLELHERRIGPTWIIFTSDHGEMLGDHHLFRKTYAYEGSAKTPLIIHPPYRVGKTCTAPVTQEDLMPTMLDIAGLPIPTSVEGCSLLPLLTATPDTVGWRDYVHGEHSACYAAEHAVQYLTDGREKYVWYTLTGEEQFFDLTSDPQECRNLANDPAARERIACWRKRMIDELAPRTDDHLSDGERLLPGTNVPAVRKALLPAIT
ncbi:MAG: arylsulfatase [Armatimonadota bacterium]